MSATLIIIIATSLVSILCFTGTLPFDSLKFSAWDVWHRKRWYQMLSYGLVHGGWGHLLFNMLTLYFFGDVVEKYFQAAFGPGTGIILYLLLYVSAIAVSTIGDLVKYKDEPHYSAVGASGAVSAILFASILFEPKMGIYMYFIPIPIPGYSQTEHGQHRPLGPLLGSRLRTGVPSNMQSADIPPLPQPVAGLMAEYNFI